MVAGDIAALWATREQASKTLHAVPVAERTDVYHSESLWIVRCTTVCPTTGAYYVVTESDVLFPEDINALEKLGACIGEPWRRKILETDIYMRPHRGLPMSNSFDVHVVHRMVPEGEPTVKVYA